MGEFRTFLNEVIFTDKQFKKHQIDVDNVVRKNFVGWDVIFWNRDSQNGDSRAIFTFISNSNVLNETLDEVLNYDNYDHFVDQVRIVHARQRHSYDDWSMKILRPSNHYYERKLSDEGVLRKLSQIKRPEIDQELWKIQRDFWHEIYGNSPDEDDAQYWKKTNRNVFLSDEKSDEKLTQFYQEAQKHAFKIVLSKHDFDNHEIKHLTQLLEKESMPREVRDKLKGEISFGKLSGKDVHSLIYEVIDLAEESILNFFDHLIDVLKTSFGVNESELVHDLWRVPRDINENIWKSIAEKFKQETGKEVNFKELADQSYFDVKLGDDWDEIFSRLHEVGEYSKFEVLYYLFGESITKRIEQFVGSNPVIHTEFSQYVEKGMKAVQSVVISLMNLGIRSSHKVPIIFSYQSWGEKSGYGDGMAAGQSWGDHVRILGDYDLSSMMNILAHELGHIVYSRLSYQQQKQIEELANTGGVYPNDYGRPNYVYSGLNKPTQNHISGNEWFATMVEWLSKNREKLVTVMPGTVKSVKLILSSPPVGAKSYKNDRANLTNR